MTLIQLLESILGKASINKSEAVFYCPFCNHYKKKLNINLESQKWHCWVCDSKGKKIYTLFKKLNVSTDKFIKLKKILKIPIVKKWDKVDKKCITLPNNFKSLLQKSNIPEYKQAIKFIKFRNITKEDILKYNIGYCDSGIYQNRIIVPSYDSEGKLNYFIGRSFYNKSKLKYKNPSVSKNIIMFELFINWDNPIILCEGIFDAIAIKRNVIPLLGKIISKKLQQKLFQHKPKVYICLDNDAISDSIKIAKKLISNGLEVYLIKMPKDQDPSSLGYSKIWSLIDKANMINELDLLTMSI